MDTAAELPNHDDGIRAELLSLPGCERVVWSGPGLDAGMLGHVDEGVELISTWLRLLAALAMRTSAELELGAPRLLTISYDERLVALAIEPDGTLLAVVTRDPSAVGLAMVKLRRWLSSRAWSRA